MKTISLFAVSLTMGSIAYADDNADGHGRALLQRADGLDVLDHHVAAPEDTIEIGVATGYTQGRGPIGGGMQRVEDVSKGGGAAELDVMYRIDKTFAVGAYGSLSKYATEINDHTGVVGVSAGLLAAAHLRPELSVDPWVSLGAGWRGLWLSPESGKNTSLQGLELARLQLGIDFRINESVAIAPMIGGSLNMFVSEDSPMTRSYTEIAEKKVNFVGFAGIAGRFDLGGLR